MSMKQNQLLIGGTLAGLIILSAYVLLDKSSTDGVGVGPEDELANLDFNSYVDPEYRAGKENSSPREAQIKNYSLAPEKFPPELIASTTIAGKTFHVVGYPDSEASSFYHYKDNHTDIPFVRSGVIVFEGNNMIWESKEYIQSVSSVKFKDINSDGIDEIEVIDIGTGNTAGRALSVYMWRKGIFELISPKNTVTTTKATFTQTRVDCCLEDINDDGIMEIVNIVSNGTIKKTYKFNGTEYKLWKEEPGTPYNPKDWEPNNG